MILSELIERLDKLTERQDLWNPKVYIRIGLNQVPIEKIEFFPETQYEEEAVVLS